MTRPLILLASIAAMWAAAPSLAAAVPGATEVRSVDPSDTDFRDLEPLGRALAGKRVVMLGEATHGDGSTFLAKSRVVRYLHERHGFDVLVFESGFVDLELAQRRIANGEDVGTVLGESVFPVWSKSDQFRFLAEYLQAQRSRGKPISVAGFDLQFTGGGTNRLGDELKGLPGDPPAIERVAALVSAAIKDRSKGLASMDEAQLERDIAGIDAALAGSSRPDAPFWRQAMASIGANLKFLKAMPATPPTAFKLREEQMAANLAWIADRRFSGRKIIVWAATSHLMRDRTAIDVTTAKNMVPMGAHFAAKRGDRDTYILAFTAAGGRAGSFARRNSTDVGAAPDGSYEADLAAAGFENAFLPLDRAGGEKRIARLLGYAPWAGHWARAVDGLFFIREMQPTTYPTVTASP